MSFYIFKNVPLIYFSFFPLCYRLWESKEFENDLQNCEYLAQEIESATLVTKKEVEDLLFCGLTSHQIEFILLNCSRLDFTVNILGFHEG